LISIWYITAYIGLLHDNNNTSEHLANMCQFTVTQIFCDVEIQRLLPCETVVTKSECFRV